MAKIIIYGDIDVSPLYISVDGGKELTVSGKYPRCIKIGGGSHHIDATTVSKLQRATSVGDGSFIEGVTNSIVNGTNTSLSGNLEFGNNDVLLIEVKLKGLKTIVNNQLMSESEASEYVNMSTVIDYGEKAPGEKNKWIALLLCLFFGVFGVHRFYEKKIGTGILYLLTCGFCGIGVIVDFFSILKRKS